MTLLQWVCYFPNMVILRRVDCDTRTRGHGYRLWLYICFCLTSTWQGETWLLRIDLMSCKIRTNNTSWVIVNDNFSLPRGAQYENSASAWVKQYKERDIIAIYCCWCMSTRRQWSWYRVLQRCCYLPYMSMLLIVFLSNWVKVTRKSKTGGRNKRNCCEGNSHVLVGLDDSGKICLVTERYRGPRSNKLVVDFLLFTLVTTYSFLTKIYR